MQGPLTADICARALAARDTRFDGLFFVGITTTRVYCRPVCPARVSVASHRRFFDTAALAERAGFRPCLRCRPELAPGRAPMDVMPRLARVAADRIAAGALNGRTVAHLAQELGVSQRHLRRALDRETGVSPVELAQTHRLLLAKRLLTDTSLSVTRIAFASGFQSLRRFNTLFRERYRLSPSALRRTPRAGEVVEASRGHELLPDLVRLTLAYRPPIAWDTLMACMARETVPGLDSVTGRRYGRTVRLDGRHGLVFVHCMGVKAPIDPAKHHVHVDVSYSLLPVLMPLLARLRDLLDLDAEPTVVDAALERGGLGPLVRRHAGLRVHGAFDGFETTLRLLLGRAAARVVAALGDAIETGMPDLTTLAPTAEQVVQAGVTHLVTLGVRRRRAEVIVAVARAVGDGSLRLEPSRDVVATHGALVDIGVPEALATMIIMRALHWPDAFPVSDPVLGGRAERWRPWRAYAALHLWLAAEAD